MKQQEAIAWLRKEGLREKIFCSIRQPLTATQLAKRLNIEKRVVSHHFRILSKYQLLTCLNPESSKGRLYWFSELGTRCHKKVMQSKARSRVSYELPEIDWILYASTCFEHRSPIIKAMEVPVSVSDIRRILVRRYSRIRISVNNIHDILQVFEAKGLVKRVLIRKRKRARYVLTETGEKFRELHVEAEKW